MIQALAAASAYTTSAAPLSHHKCPYATLVERSTTADSSAGELYRRPSKYRIKTIRRMVPIFPAPSPRESATWLEKSIIRQGSGSSFGSATRFVPNTQPQDLSLD